jgi:hypothetical protein
VRGMNVVLLAMAIASFAPSALAIDEAEMKARIKDRRCPANPQQVPLFMSYNEVCGEPPKEASFEYIHCQDRLTALNELISRYNDFLSSQCSSRPQRETDLRGNPKANRISPSSVGSGENDDLASRVKKSGERGTANQTANEQKEADFLQKYNDDKKLQEQREKRDSDLELQRRRDAERRADEEVQRRADEEIERNRRQLAEARKWHCYGSPANVDGGFRQCQSACDEFYEGSYCHHVCYVSGDGSEAHGRSCFKEP